MEAKVRFPSDTCRGLFDLYRLAKQKWKQLVEAQQIQVKPRLTTEFQSGAENDASSKNVFMTCDNYGTRPWSDLNHELLFLVMMQLGVVDFFAFSRVCKSWSSLALINEYKFMASRLPMSIRISTYPPDKKSYCYLEDLEGRKFKTTLLYSTCLTYIGSTYGYLILHTSGDSGFWLVNPITRHELHFPSSPFDFFYRPKALRCILVFSRAISRWVFLVRVGSKNVYFSFAGQGTWKQASSSFPIVDLDVFKGRIYILSKAHCLYELSLYPKPKVTLLKTKNFPSIAKVQQLVCSCKKLYVMEYLSKDCYKFHKLDFGEMSWVSCEKTEEECAFIHSAAVKHGLKGKHQIYIPMIFSKLNNLIDE